MSDIVLEGADFDRYLSLTERAVREAAIAANERFVLAMAKAISRGREKATPGTFVDNSPPIGAKKLRGMLPMSVCGSPSAMCMESGGSHSGAEAMK